MKICIVAGARPNFMKVAPLIHAIRHRQQKGCDLSYQLVYAGDEEDPTLETTLFDDLGIDPPQVYLHAESESLNVLAGNMMFCFDEYLASHPTDVVIVVDDLASTMAASITTKKRGVMLAHLVAGTRSFDINMPKEINRLVIDGLSDLLFTAGAAGDSNVNRGGGELAKTFMVGNILMDTLRSNYDQLKKPDIITSHGFGEKDYLALTINRKAILRDMDKLHDLLNAVAEGAKGTPVIAPVREEAANAIESIQPRLPFVICPPLSYLEFGWLVAHAKGIITDSGNVAEEATFSSVPCITLNSYTEHYETVSVGSNMLVGEDPVQLRGLLSDIVDGHWKACQLPDRWDGRTADRIITILLGIKTP